MLITRSCPKRLEKYVALKPGDSPLWFRGRALKIASHQTYVLEARKMGGHPDLVARVDGNDVIVLIDPDRRRVKPRA